MIAIHIKHWEDLKYQMRDPDDPWFADRWMQELLRGIEDCIDELSPKQKVKLLWAITKCRLPSDTLL